MKIVKIEPDSVSPNLCNFFTELDPNLAYFSFEFEGEKKKHLESIEMLIASFNELYGQE